MLHFHVFSRFPEPLQLPIRVPSFNQGIQNCNVDSKHPCRRFWLPVGTGDLLLSPLELSYRSKHTTNGSSAVLPTATAISSSLPARRDVTRICEDPLLRLVFPLSVLSPDFFFSEWLDSRMWSWPLNFLAFVSDRCHRGDVICPAVLIATRRFCCSSWRLIRKSCLQSVMRLLRVHPCPVLCLCLRQCSLFPSHRRREHKGCSWREGHFAPLQFHYASGVSLAPHPHFARRKHNQNSFPPNS